MGDLPKLAWSRDVTGKVDNIHSNLFLFSRSWSGAGVPILRKNVQPASDFKVVFEVVMVVGGIGVARIFDWGGAQTTNHT